MEKGECCEKLIETLGLKVFLHELIKFGKNYVFSRNS